MNLQKEIKQLQRLLEKNADERYRKGNAMTVPSDLKMIGVRVPILKKIAKDWVRENKELNEAEFLKLIKTLWRKPVFELRSLAQELLIANKDYWPKFDWEIGESWLNDVDNWVHCDVLSWQIFGFLVLWNRSYLKNLKSYLQKPGKWHRRAAIVSTVQLIRNKKIKAEEILVMIDQTADDQDPMIQKAISWVLREIVRAGEKKPVEKYIKKNQNKLATYVIREVNNKLQTGLKSGKRKT